MSTLFNALKRAYLLFMIRSLERELHDQREAAMAAHKDHIARIIIAESETREELAKFRGAYTALLPVGEINVWPMA